MVMPGDNVEMMCEMYNPLALENGQRFNIREGGRTVSHSSNSVFQVTGRADSENLIGRHRPGHTGHQIMYYTLHDRCSDFCGD